MRDHARSSSLITERVGPFMFPSPLPSKELKIQISINSKFKRVSLLAGASSSGKAATDLSQRHILKKGSLSQIQS